MAERMAEKRAEKMVNTKAVWKVDKRVALTAAMMAL